MTLEAQVRFLPETPQVRTCLQCAEAKALDEFHFLNKRKHNRRRSTCKKCWNEYNKYYRKTNPPDTTRLLARNKKNKNIQRQKLIEIVTRLKSLPCLDCKQKFNPWQMQFDHVRGQKIDNVSVLVGQACSTQKFLDEVAKCEVVCANCHADRTYQRRSIPSGFAKFSDC